MIENTSSDTNTSRTEQLRRSGRAKSLPNGASAPFVQWPQDDEFVFIEGKVVGVWEGMYGMVARLSVSTVSANARGVTGSGDSQSRAPIEIGREVNVGLNYAALHGVSEEQVGRNVHLAFLGWGQTKDGNRFRQFEVLEFDDVELDDGPEEL